MAELPRGVQDMNPIYGALSYPTPILMKLVPKGLSFDPLCSAFPMFPNAPVLEQVTVLDCDIRSAPNFGNITELEIIPSGWERCFMSTPTFNLGTSIQRLSLCLTRHGVIQFPPNLPKLRVLELLVGPLQLPEEMLTCEMPQLTSLSLKISNFLTLYELFHCRGINLSRLGELTLNLERMWRNHITDHPFSGSVVQLLERAYGLEDLYANEDSLTPILEMLLNAQGFQASTLLRGVCLVNLDTKDRIAIDGEGIQGAISHFRLHGS